MNLNAKKEILSDERLYFQTLQNRKPTKAISNLIHKEKIIMKGFNYLGLAEHKEVINAALNELHNSAKSTSYKTEYNDSSFHDKLNNIIKIFFDQEDCIIFNSEYIAYTSFILSLSKNTIIFSDKNSHFNKSNFIIPESRFIEFKHNDPQNLRFLLEQFKDHTNKWLALTGTFLDTGENANITDLISIANEYNTKVYLDDSCLIGIEGKNKRGLAEKTNIYTQIDLLMGSFQMVFGSIGAFISGSKELIVPIKKFTETQPFSWKIPTVNICMIIKSFSILNSNTGNNLIQKLHNNSNYLRKELKHIGYKLCSENTNIISIYISNDDAAGRMSEILFNEGVLVKTFIYPFAPKGQALIKLICLATHKKKHLNKCIEIMNKTGKKLGIIKTKKQLTDSINLNDSSDIETCLQNSHIFFSSTSLKKFTQLNYSKRKEQQKIYDLFISRNYHFIPHFIQKKIKSITLCFLGCGLGANIALLSARLGFQNFLLYDFDSIELSNLNRQPYFRENIYKDKANTLKEYLLKINPSINIKSENRKVDLDFIKNDIKNFDFCVNTIDFGKEYINITDHVSKRKGIPVLIPMNIGFGSFVMVFNNKSKSFQNINGTNNYDMTHVITKLIEASNINFEDYISPNKIFSEISIKQYDPQLGLASSLTSALVNGIIIKILAGEAVKTSPQAIYVDLYSSIKIKGQNLVYQS